MDVWLIRGAVYTVSFPGIILCHKVQYLLLDSEVF